MNIIRWIGTAASILGSFIVALQIFVVGYVLFMLGSLSWLFVAVKTKDKALAILNGTFLCANIVGLVKALG